MKAHQNMTLKELRDYVRTKKLNKIVQLTMSKPALIEGLKKIDHWEDVEKKKRTRLAKGVLQVGKKPDKPQRIDTSNKNKGMVLKSEPKKKKRGDFLPNTIKDRKWKQSVLGKIHSLFTDYTNKVLSSEIKGNKWIVKYKITEVWLEAMYGRTEEEKKENKKEIERDRKKTFISRFTIPKE